MYMYIYAIFKKSRFTTTRVQKENLNQIWKNLLQFQNNDIMKTLLSLLFYDE